MGYEQNHESGGQQIIAWKPKVISNLASEVAVANALTEFRAAYQKPPAPSVADLADPAGRTHGNHHGTNGPSSEWETGRRYMTRAGFRTRSKVEKELGAKVQGAEAKAAEATTKMQALAREKKDLEGKHLKDMEDQAAKQKAELDRREQVKAQEVQRLQAAVQEKSKALKVVELELARYKNKPAGAPAKPGAAVPAKPAATGGIAGAVSALGDEMTDEATRANVIPVDMRTEAVRVPPTTQPGPPSARAAASATQAVPAVKPPGAAGGPVLTAAPPGKRPPEREERTVVMPAGTTLPPKKKGDEDDEADFTSLNANLGD